MTSTPQQNTSDGSLIRRFRAGEDDAATALYARYVLKLQRLADRNTGQDLASRFDADDVVQSVFRTFFRRVQLGDYDLPAGEELWRLLLVLALNKIRKLATHHRAQRRNVATTELAEPERLAQLMKPGDDDLAVRSLEEVIGELTSSLSPSHQQIIRLRIEGYKQGEIAIATQRTERTVERVLQNFRTRLRSMIDESTATS
jgi:RNA polymerase sigma-70 factor (ECF subfamily)